MPRIAAGELEFEYCLVGPPNGDLLVLSTGFGDQLTVWPISLQSALADSGFQVLSFDTRDAGLSSESHGYRLDDLADDLISIAAAVVPDAQSINIVGYSMGGQIAMRAALRYPERVRSLALLFSTSGAPDLSKPSWAAISGSISISERVSRPEAINRRIELMLVASGPGFQADERVASAIANADFDRAYRPEGVARHLEAMTQSRSVYDELSRISCSCLVIQASHDCFFGEDHGDDLARRLGCELKIVNGAGHNLSEELGDFLARSLVPFFAIDRVVE